MLQRLGSFEAGNSAVRILAKIPKVTACLAKWDQVSTN
jgi:hypothetical protein